MDVYPKRNENMDLFLLENKNSFNSGTQQLGGYDNQTNGIFLML